MGVLGKEEAHSFRVRCPKKIGDIWLILGFMKASRVELAKPRSLLPVDGWFINLNRSRCSPFLGTPVNWGRVGANDVVEMHFEGDTIYCMINDRVAIVACKEVVIDSADTLLPALFAKSSVSISLVN